jgi:hypothetical protein
VDQWQAGRSIDVGQLATEAYVYLHPLVLMELTRRHFLDGSDAEMGVMDHRREFPAAGFRAVVRPNRDTLYSSVWIDLSAEPHLLTVPKADGRYYMFPVLDMWTEVLGVIGSRTVGDGPATVVLVGPDWVGDLPADVPVFRTTTPTVWIIGRTYTVGGDDLGAVHEFQDQVTLVPLGGPSAGLASVPTRDGPTVPRTPPAKQVLGMDAESFFSLGLELLTREGAHATDHSQLFRMRRLGMEAGRSFVLDDCDETSRDAILAAPAASRKAIIEAAVSSGLVVNGWRRIEGSIGVYGNDYLLRAMVAQWGLGANPGEDSVYINLVADSDGNPIDGANTYVLRFEAGQLPPVDAFWSITTYDTDGFFIANELDRVSLGDRDDLRFGPDGSLELVLSPDPPTNGEIGNWLPTMPGRFSATFRFYDPRPEILAGTWACPPVRMIDE